MRVLIVDDDTSRANKLIDHLVAVSMFPPETLKHVADARSAKVLLRAEYFDAMILDVVLPRRIDDGHPSATIGLELLDEVSRSGFLKKPEKIIGITAFSADMPSFRDKFSEYCSVVIDADATSEVWRAQISDALNYTMGSMISRQATAAGVAVFTVHGIRTFGEWQQRLRNIVSGRCTDVAFYSYKYGYFSALSLLLPWSRMRQVNLMRDRLRGVSDSISGSSIYIFAHSFGTYLVAETLRKVCDEIQDRDVTVVLCGSVLPEDYDWSFLPRRVRVINECGSRDLVLYLPKALIPGLGMAGKVGFNGFNQNYFFNRFYVGGHSHYFDGDRFMSTAWLPLISGSSSLSLIDERGAPGSASVFLDSVVVSVSRCKILILPIIIISLATILWSGLLR